MTILHMFAQIARLRRTVLSPVVGIALTTALGSVGSVMAQNNSGSQLLTAPVDARAAAMGGLGLISSDRNELYTLPSSILYQERTLSISADGLYYAMPLTDGVSGALLHGAATAAWRIDKHHAVMVGGRYRGGLSYPRVSDQYGTVGQRRSSPYEYTLDLAYAFRISDHWALFATGAYVQSYSGRAAIGGAFSLGGQYRTHLTLGATPAHLGVALRIADFGAPLYYSRKVAFALPTRADLTADLALYASDGLHIGTLALGARYTDFLTKQKGVEVMAGGELRLVRQLLIRAGGHYSSVGSSFGTLGLGWEQSRFRADMGLQLPTLKGLPSRLVASLSYAF